MLNDIGKIYKRPWGTYLTTRVEESEKNGKILRTIEEKEITVNPGGQLSIQNHTKRDEKWTILEGHPEILIVEHKPDLTQVEKLFRPYKPGDVLHIKKNWIHAVRNLTDQFVKLHEIQSGICEEDDITRYLDIYGRI